MEKAERQRRIVDLLARNRIDSQEQLVDLMLAEGLSTTQSTLSRDLRELGVVKGPDGYGTPDVDRRRLEAVRAVATAVRPRIESIEVGGNIVVLRARDHAAASRVAKDIDGARLYQAVSAVALDTTVLVIGRTAAYARDLARLFKS